jgi:hypothetical protein
MKKSAMQLGKALNDPIKGITALTRVGVSFTEGRRRDQGAMVKSGDTMGAQKLILHELNKEFGGSAEAAGKTLPGQLATSCGRVQQLRRRGRREGRTGTRRLHRDHPRPHAADRDDHDVGVQRHRRRREARVAAAEAWPSLDLWDVFNAKLLPVIKDFGRLFSDAVTAVAGVVQKNMPAIKTIFSNLGEIIKDIAHVAIPLLKIAFTVILPAAINVALPVLAAVTGAVKGIFNTVGDVVDAFKKMPGNIADAITGGLSTIKKAVSDVFGKVIGWVKDVLGIKSPSAVFFDIGKNVVLGFIHGVGSMAGTLAHAVKDMVGNLIPDSFKQSGVGGIRPPIGEGPYSTGGLVPQVVNALSYARSHGWHGTVISGFRSYAEQAALYSGT